MSRVCHPSILAIVVDGTSSAVALKPGSPADGEASHE